MIGKLSYDSSDSQPCYDLHLYKTMNIYMQSIWAKVSRGNLHYILSEIFVKFVVETHVCRIWAVLVSWANLVVPEVVKGICGDPKLLWKVSQNWPCFFGAEDVEVGRRSGIGEFRENLWEFRGGFVGILRGILLKKVVKGVDVSLSHL